MRGARRAWRWGAPVLAAAVLLAVPGGAAARGGRETYVAHGGSTTTGRVRATHGFRVKFVETSTRHFKVKVLGHRSETTYTTRGGPYASGRVSARLGRRGRFDLRFVPVGRPRRIAIPRWCKGPPAEWQRGYLAGRYRFRGERDFTEAAGVRVSAARLSWSPLRCHYLDGSPRQEPAPRARLQAWRRGRTSLAFGALLYPRGARPAARQVRFRAEISRRAGRLSIVHEAEVEAPASAITFPGGPQLPEVVTVSPPAPFSGSATFDRTPESTFTWSGDLAVRFPGLDPLRLSGPRFGARVCALQGCVSKEPETE
jgi:hypothetical protein